LVVFVWDAAGYAVRQKIATDYTEEHG